MMWCAKCNKHLSECVCPDMDERMASLEGASNFVFKKCNKCGKHYARCKCDNPEWVSSVPGIALPENKRTENDQKEEKEKGDENRTT